MPHVDASLPPQGPQLIPAPSVTTPWLTPTTQTTNYTALDRDHVIANGTLTVTLPASVAGRIVAVTVRGTSQVVTISAASGNIWANGVATTPVKISTRGSGVLLVADGTNWYAAGMAANDAGWQTTSSGVVAMAGAWAQSGNLVVRRDGANVVHVKGTITTLDTSGTTALTLAAGYRPGQALTCVIATNDITKPATGLIGTDGTVKVTYTAGITSVLLDGLTPFIAEN